MNIQNIANVLINNLSYVSMAIIVVIVAIFLIAVVINFLVSSKYKKLIKQLSETNYEGMEIYKGKVLNAIVSAYKETYQKSKDFVNTQAIMESKFFSLQSGLLAQEKFLSVVTTMLVTLGASGSIYGIICIATRLNIMFEQAKNLDITDMQQVYGDMSVILAFLAYAFVTTFVAIIATFVYSLITSMTNIELLRGNFFARLEDYLDNELGSTLSQKRQGNEQKVVSSNNNLSGTDNSNILYMLENTSHSMMTSTSKLETTISKLNESLLEILSSDEMDMLEKKYNNKNNAKDKKEDDYKTITLKKSKEIINKQYENKNKEVKENIEKVEKLEVKENIQTSNDVSAFVDPINEARIETAVLDKELEQVLTNNTLMVQSKVTENVSSMPNTTEVPMVDASTLIGNSVQESAVMTPISNETVNAENQTPVTTVVNQESLNVQNNIPQQ